MVVISACISSRVRPLLSRQFVDIRRAKVEGLLNAFVKLVDYSGSDHTYLETESVRYVYQPVENLYLVLITTKSSNIFEDLGTLRMFVSIVQDTCGESQANSSLEESVAAHAFDIIFMLDELISGGYREALTLQQIQSFVAMDSHEEKLQKMIAEGKEKEQADRRREIAQRLEKERLAAKKAGKGLDGSSFRGAAAASFQQPPRTPAASASPAAAPTEAYWASPGSTGGVHDSRHQTSPSGPPGSFQQPKGMQLGVMRPMGGDEGLLQNLVQSEQGKPGGAQEVQPEQVAKNPLAEPVSILIEEKVKASLQAEGVLKEVELQGTFFATANDPQRGSLAAFQLSPEDKRFKMKCHPNVDKNALSANNLLQIRDTSRPLVPHQPAPLLKWRVNEKDESLVPLAVSCWPSTTPTGTALTVELEVTDTSKRLEDVHVSFMCPPQANPQVGHLIQGVCGGTHRPLCCCCCCCCICAAGTVTAATAYLAHIVVRTDAGTTEHDGISVHWFLPEMGEELSSATIELTANTSLATLMPFSVELHSRENICNVQVLQCNHMETKAEIPFSLTRKVEYLLTINP
ncbi:hypothetical protein Emed_001265 [Eimeria media]